ncbi:hypothetical protein IAE22_33925, partial [Bacillus sp. S34]|nr:hypothetical protein [Bacillus sp. S34]
KFPKPRNVIGLVLGTAFRFWLYKVWVYHPERSGQGEPAEARTDTSAVPTAQ